MLQHISAISDETKLRLYTFVKIIPAQYKFGYIYRKLKFRGHGCLIEAKGKHASQLCVSITSVQDFGFWRVVECNLSS